MFGAGNERAGAKDWGVMRRDGTVKPVYSAISTMLCELVSARLLGEIKAEKGVRAFLFRQPDGTETVMFWSISPVDERKGGSIRSVQDVPAKLSLPAGDGEYSISDLCGTRSRVAATNGVLKLETSRYPAYVAGLHGLLADVPPHPRGNLDSHGMVDDEASEVILRVDLDRTDFSIANRKALAILERDSGRMRLQLWNMGNCATTGHVEVAGATLRGLPGKIVVGPRGSGPTSLKCTLVPANGEGFMRDVVLRGVFGGRSSSRLSMPLRLGRRTRECCTVVPINWRSPAAWKRNTSAQSYSAAWDPDEQALRFEFKWTKHSGRWFYPEYMLKLPDEGLAGAVSLEFEVKSVQDKAENEFSTSLLYLLHDEDGCQKEETMRYPPPTGAWESRQIDFSDGDMSGVTAFRIGANPRGTNCVFWIRNMNLLKRRSP